MPSRGQCPSPSPSSDGRMSASPPCSTGSIGKKLALVDDQPGLTRDRRQAETELGTCAVTFIDTAGFEPGDQGLTPRMRQQTEAAVAQADLVLFLIDARAGVVPADQILAELVRGSGKQVILAANKCEGRAARARRLRSLFARSRRAAADLGGARSRHRRGHRDHRAGVPRARWTLRTWPTPRHWG